ncbi:SDR family oxidoreductase [Mucilaginibacter pallidiroseus]|uniref:SDR family oxidoreductase n=1 Tax=Mucilaginibacter pallidiroseus TaxID=2599295 RepID=A0A563U3J0_9SPHI|nr:SDR family oxidoreductase [Mucilaginibacter pallidiroseus]TWR25900.1 SDR family oxidoreductase [Mucilaginibacter pallidiroseus]
MILVTGATGNLGKATINSLLNKGVPPNDITVLVRDKNKASELKLKGLQISVGDYQDIGSLMNAFKGIDKLLLISSSSDIIYRLRQHKNVIDAAKQSGVNHLIYTGFAMKDLKLSSMHKDVDYHAYTTDYLKQTGVPYTVMNNTMYADMVPIIGGKDILKNGISIPAEDGKVPFLPITEMAEALAAVLTTPGHEFKEYVIAAEKAYSFAEIAVMLSEITGASVTYNPVKLTSYVSQLVQLGVSQDDAEYISRYAVAMAKGEFEINKSDIQLLIGRSPIRLKDFLTSIYGTSK